MNNSLKSDKNTKNKNDFQAKSLKSNNIEIEVTPSFVNKQAALLGEIFIWSYIVKITNNSGQKTRLIGRHWEIIDEKGVVQNVDGQGVVGKQPEILPGEFFEYESGVHLNHPSGIMKGSYDMENENKEMFQVEIPAFSLDIDSLKNTLN